MFVENSHDTVPTLELIPMSHAAFVKTFAALE
jgi:hypothetical protein